VTGGDQWGANKRYQNYTANLLNQYTTRTVPGYVDILGAAATNATVTVLGSAGDPPAVPGDPPGTSRATRQGEYSRCELSFDNTAAPLWLGVTSATVNGPG